MSIPTFLVVGAPKTGTTWIHRCLLEHPEVFVPNKKEINFFSFHYEKGYDWYKSFFDNGETEKGEVSPSYMACEGVPKRIKSANPDVKIIFVVRDPIERAYSGYCMDLRAGRISGRVDKELQKGESQVDIGLYNRHICRFEKKFCSDQIDIFVFDNLKNSPKRFISKIYSSINVNSKFMPKFINKKIRTRKSVPKSKIAYRTLAYLVKKVKSSSNIGEGIIYYLRQWGVFDAFHEMNDGGEYPKMSESKERELARYYEEDVKKLSKRVEEDLYSKWIAPRLDHT
jgi:hypothetical protein